MDFKTFLENNKITYKAIWYFISEKTDKKTPIGEMNNLSLEKLKKESKIHGKRPTYYKVKDERVDLTLNEYDNLERAYSLYLKHTDDLYCLDVDMPEIKSLNDLMKYDKEFKIFKNCSWVKGNTKGIHIYLRVSSFPKLADDNSEIDVFHKIKGDFIHKKNNMWEKNDKRSSQW